MFYAEINEYGKCFHVTDNPLPLSDTILEVESADVLGKIWNGLTWEGEDQPTEPEPQPTQLDRIEQKIDELGAESLSISKMEKAIAEGVNEV